MLTFVNKMDAEGRPPLDLMAEVEDILGIGTYAMNWPTGSGQDFLGVINRSSNELLRFEKAGVAGSKPAIIHRHGLEDADNGMDEAMRERLSEELELLEIAGDHFDQQAFLNAEISPVFFGSALTNFGIEPFFDAFVDLAPEPQARSVTQLDNGERNQWQPADAPSAPMSSRFRPTWTPSIATVSPLCASAPACSNATPR